MACSLIFERLAARYTSHLTIFPTNIRFSYHTLGIISELRYHASTLIRRYVSFPPGTLSPDTMAIPEVSYLVVYQDEPKIRTALIVAEPPHATMIR